MTTEKAKWILVDNTKFRNGELGSCFLTGVTIQGEEAIEFWGGLKYAAEFSSLLSVNAVKKMLTQINLLNGHTVDFVCMPITKSMFDMNY